MEKLKSAFTIDVETNLGIAHDDAAEAAVDAAFAELRKRKAPEAKPASLDELPAPLRAKAREVRVHFDALKDLVEVLEHPHMPAARLVLERKKRLAWNATVDRSNALLSLLESLLFTPKELELVGKLDQEVAKNEQALARRGDVVGVFPSAPPSDKVSVSSPPAPEGFVYHEERPGKTTAHPVESKTWKMVDGHWGEIDCFGATPPKAIEDAGEAAKGIFAEAVRKSIAAAEAAERAKMKYIPPWFEQGGAATPRPADVKFSVTDAGAKETIRSCIAKLAMPLDEVTVRISGRELHVVGLERNACGDRITLDDGGGHNINIPYDGPARVAMCVHDRRHVIEPLGLPTYSW